MGRSVEKMRVAATLMACIAVVNSQEGSIDAGPAWVHADYMSSPPVYPSRERSLTELIRLGQR